MSAPSSRSSADLAQRLAGVGRVLLVGAAVALELRVDGLAERAVERATRTSRRRPGSPVSAVARRVERVPDDADLAVHHPAGADARGHRHRPARRPSARRSASVASLSTRPLVVEHAAVAVVGELVEAGVGHEHGIASPTSARTSRSATLRMPSGSIPPDPMASRRAGTPNSMSPPTTGRRPPRRRPCAASHGCAGRPRASTRSGAARRDPRRRTSAARGAAGARRSRRRAGAGRGGPQAAGTVGGEHTVRPSDL